MAARRPPLRLGSIARGRVATTTSAGDTGQGGHSSGRCLTVEKSVRKADKQLTYLLTYLLTYQQQAPSASTAKQHCAPCWHLNALRTRSRACLSRESSTTPLDLSMQRNRFLSRESWPLLRSGRARPTRKRRWWPPAFTIGCRHSCSSPSPLAPLPIAARASRSVICARCKRSALGFWATCPTCRLTPTLTPTPPQNPDASTPTPTPTLAVTPALTFIRLTRMRWCKREASTH